MKISEKQIDKLIHELDTATGMLVVQEALLKNNLELENARLRNTLKEILNDAEQLNDLSKRHAEPGTSYYSFDSIIEIAKDALKGSDND